jgi:CubicO group peptidase (beta-lactamase class C family)
MSKKLLLIATITVGSIYLYSNTHNNCGEWFIKEQDAFNQRRNSIAQKYWDTYIIEQPHDDYSGIKNILATQSTVNTTPENINQQFDTAVSTKNYTAFAELFTTVNDFGLSVIDIEEQLSIPFEYGNFYDCKNKPTINSTDIENLQQYIKDSNFSGVASIRHLDTTHIVSSSKNIDHSTPFSIHSISKVFTEILTLLLIQEGIIQEEWLQQPLRINEATKKLLPHAVRKQLKKTTTEQIMTHRGGFGDYTIDYFNELAARATNGEIITFIKKLDNFLQYADDTIATLNNDETRYSNLGLLLLGLSIEHCYNTAMQHNSPLSFDEILHKYIIKPADMHIFTSQKPQNGCYNEFGSCSQYISASPAGGHWTTADDLQKFSSWFQKKYTTDITFKQLLEKYGSEFYNFDTQEAHHCGGIGQPGIGAASTRFALFLRHEMSIVILSNRSQQAHIMYKTIYHNLLADQN